jgi:hypothetical protein
MGARLALLGCIFAVALGVVVAPATGRSSWTAPPPNKMCRGLNFEDNVWGVDGTGVGCRFQRRWTLHRLRKGTGHPRGWKCSGGLEFEGGACHKARHRTPFFEFYAED